MNADEGWKETMALAVPKATSDPTEKVKKREDREHQNSKYFKMPLPICDLHRSIHLVSGILVRSATQRGCRNVSAAWTAFGCAGSCFYAESLRRARHRARVRPGDPTAKPAATLLPRPRTRRLGVVPCRDTPPRRPRRARRSRRAERRPRADLAASEPGLVPPRSWAVCALRRLATPALPVAVATRRALRHGREPALPGLRASPLRGPRTRAA